MTRDARQRLRLLVDLGRAFAERLELDELVPLVLSGWYEALDAEAAAVLLLDPERQELYFPYIAGDDTAAEELRTMRFPADRGIAGAVLRSGAPARVDDVAADSRFYGGVDRRTGHTTRALVCAPLVTRQGRIGVVQVLNPRHAPAFTDDDLELLAALAGSVAAAIENARLRTVLEAQRASTPAATVAAVLDAVEAHAAGAPQYDDVTALCVRRGARGPEGSRGEESKVQGRLRKRRPSPLPSLQPQVSRGC